MNILAIPGSLRSASINAAFCRAASRLAPAPLRISVFAGLGALPHFNPDLEADPPRAVREFRDAVGNASAVLFASPEYAHGVSGVLKNALDWLVSFEGFISKPVVLVNTSPRAHHAYDALREVLKTMSADILSDACMTLPLLGGNTTEEAIVSSTELAPRIRESLRTLALELGTRSGTAPSFPLE
jgi:chromate reductase